MDVTTDRRFRIILKEKSVLEFWRYIATKGSAVVLRSASTLSCDNLFCYGFNRMRPCGQYMCRTVVTICTARFSIQQSYVLPTQCIYVFCVDLRTNSDYFPIQH